MIVIPFWLALLFLLFIIICNLGWYFFIGCVFFILLILVAFKSSKISEFDKAKRAFKEAKNAATDSINKEEFWNKIEKSLISLEKSYPSQYCQHNISVINFVKDLLKKHDIENYNAALDRAIAEYSKCDQNRAENQFDSKLFQEVIEILHGIKRLSLLLPYSKGYEQYIIDKVNNQFKNEIKGLIFLSAFLCLGASFMYFCQNDFITACWKFKNISLILESGSYSIWGLFFLIILGLCLLIFCLILISLPFAYIDKLNHKRSYAYKNVLKLGKAAEVLSIIDEDLKNKVDLHYFHHFIFSSKFFFDIKRDLIYRLEEIVWCYVKLNEYNNTSYIGLTSTVVLGIGWMKNGKSRRATLNIFFKNGTKFSYDATKMEEAQNIDFCIKELQTRVPWIAWGYDQEMKKTYNHKRDVFISQIDQRRKSSYNNPSN